MNWSQKFRKSEIWLDTRSASGKFSNLRIRLLFRLRLPSSIPQKFTYVFIFRNYRRDSCYCRIWKVTLGSGSGFSQVFDSGSGSGSEWKTQHPAEVDSDTPDSWPALLATRDERNVLFCDPGPVLIFKNSQFKIFFKCEVQLKTKILEKCSLFTTKTPRSFALTQSKYGPVPKFRSDLQPGYNPNSTKFAVVQCQAKFLTCEISDFTPNAHAQSNILHIKYAKKFDDWGLGIRV